jgi:hypothetical protein
MKKYLLLFAILVATVLVSCEEDDPVPPPHEVGSWELKNYAVINVPNGFQSSEGRTFELNELNLRIDAYSLIMNANGTYSREITVTDRIPEEDTGTYTIEEDELVLNSDDFDDDEVYGLERNKNNDLWISQPIQFPLIEDAILDTLTQEYYESLTPEERQEKLISVVNLDLVFAFEKEE